MQRIETCYVFGKTIITTHRCSISYVQVDHNPDWSLQRNSKNLFVESIRREPLQTQLKT
jgi:hypothetical protein